MYFLPIAVSFSPSLSLLFLFIQEINSPNRPSSPYFRTRSPTVQPANTPYLGFVSPYAYMASLATPPSKEREGEREREQIMEAEILYVHVRDVRYSHRYTLSCVL